MFDAFHECRIYFIESIDTNIIIDLFSFRLINIEFVPNPPRQIDCLAIGSHSFEIVYIREITNFWRMIGIWGIVSFDKRTDFVNTYFRSGNAGLWGSIAYYFRVSIRVIRYYVCNGGCWRGDCTEVSEIISAEESDLSVILLASEVNGEGDVYIFSIMDLSFTSFSSLFTQVFILGDSAELYLCQLRSPISFVAGL